MGRVVSAGEDFRYLRCVQDYRFELPISIKERLGQILLGTVLTNLYQLESVSNNLV